MRWFRTALLHVIVWLTSSAVVIAGLPNVQCRCPSSGTKPASSAAKCCCCGMVAVENDDEDATPSCCHPSQMPTKESNEPAFRATDCEKAIALPHDAAGLNNSDKGFQPTNVDATPFTIVTCIDGNLSAVSTQADVAAPPPRNLQLVLQHFLI